MEFIDEPWGFTTLVCGQPIVVTIPQLVKWFETGEQIYAYRKWPEITEGTIRDYKRWFVPRLINDQEIFTTSLPRLAFHFINNILTPKATLKTNMEINSIFYLRHLLSMDRQFYIPFIIISHMKHAYQVKNINLPFANLITRILRLHLRNIPQIDRIHPTNLFHELPNLGWLNNSIGEPPGMDSKIPDQ
jgi:hypothetical protein